MTSIIEKVVAIIAPHCCVGCGNYNNILCAACADAVAHFEAPFCVHCGNPTTDWHICKNCQALSALQRVYAAAEYTGVTRQVLAQFKFEHARAAAKPLAALLSAALPYFDNSWLVVPVPTASNHVRQRSYDHARLLAREFAALRGLRTEYVLMRTANARQVGATRRQRQQQVKNLFQTRPGDLHEYKILLIDDICTTGATLNAATEALLRAGAAEVVAAVVAWQPPKHHIFLK